MDFFTDPDIVDMAESHAQEVLALSESETDRIVKSYRRVRQDLRDRLDMLPSGTFTAQRMRSVIIQIDQALKAMGQGLSDDMSEAAQTTAELGVEHMITEVQGWDKHYLGGSGVTPLDIDVVKSATDTSKLLINNFPASINAYSANLRSQLAQGLGDGVIAGDTTEQILKQIGQSILGEEWRLRRVARTELQGIYSRAKLNSMIQVRDDGQVPDLMKTLWNPMDNRTAADSKYVQTEVDAGDPHLIVDLEDYFEYRWKGKLRKYLSPPDRPNDRSVALTVRKAWLDKSGTKY